MCTTALRGASRDSRAHRGKRCAPASLCGCLASAGAWRGGLSLALPVKCTYGEGGVQVRARMERGWVSGPGERLQRLCNKDRMAGESGESAGRRQAGGVEPGSAGVHAVVSRSRKGKCAARWEGEVEMPVRLAVRSSDGQGGWAGRTPSQGRCTVRDSFWIAQSLLEGEGSAGCPSSQPGWVLDFAGPLPSPRASQRAAGGR